MPKKKPAPDLSRPTVIEKIGAVIEMDIELTNGNDGQGHAWYRTKDEVKAITKSLIALKYQFRPLEFPVKLRITRLIGKGKQYWDPSSILSGNVKQLIDSMVACNWFVDDSRKWVTAVIPHQVERRDKPPGVRIEIFRLDEPIVM